MKKDKKIFQNMEKLIEGVKIPELECFNEFKQLDRNSRNFAFYRKKLQRCGQLGIIKKFSAITATLVLALFIGALSISPAFADLIFKTRTADKAERINGLNNGIKQAINNNYKQHVGKSDEHDNITFTVDDILVDKTTLVIFYTIENNNPEYKNERIIVGPESYILYGDGKYVPLQYRENTTRLSDNTGMIKYDFTDVAGFSMPDKFIFKTELRTTKTEFNEFWEFEIPIDKASLDNDERNYVLNKTIDVAGQKIIIKELTVTPVNAIINLSLDKENSMQIFGFKDLMLVDENGIESYMLDRDSTIAERIKKYNNINIKFESFYFSDFDEIYLKFNAVKALDKDNTEIVINMDDGQLVKAPEGIDIKNPVVNGNRFSCTIYLDQAKHKNGRFDIDPSSAKVANNALMLLSIKGDVDKLNVDYTFKNKLEGTISIRIIDFSNYIREETKVRLLP